ncbi:uncharacterized protein LOC135385826 isoform X2 [Ornithodoros turicata]|uniref:uncharacterized protein LOC135385826 isoform X2 n=1 Tax=Ornithodoros turicata TaxID=34597 RepID=UPI003138E1B1
MSASQRSSGEPPFQGFLPFSIGNVLIKILPGLDSSFGHEMNTEDMITCSELSFLRGPTEDLLVPSCTTTRSPLSSRPSHVTSRRESATVENASQQSCVGSVEPQLASYSDTQNSSGSVYQTSIDTQTLLGRHGASAPSIRDSPAREHPTKTLRVTSLFAYSVLILGVLTCTALFGYSTISLYKNGGQLRKRQLKDSTTTPHVAHSSTANLRLSQPSRTAHHTSPDKNATSDSPGLLRAAVSDVTFHAENGTSSNISTQGTLSTLVTP